MSTMFFHYTHMNNVCSVQIYNIPWLNYLVNIFLTRLFSSAIPQRRMLYCIYCHLFCYKRRIYNITQFIRFLQYPYLLKNIPYLSSFDERLYSPYLLYLNHRFIQQLNVGNTNSFLVSNPGC